MDVGTLLTENNAQLAALVDALMVNNELLTRMYVVQLFTIGVTGAIIVCVILHNFLKKFY